MPDELSDSELQMLIWLTKKRLRYEERRVTDYAEQKLKIVGMNSLLEKLERMRLAA